MPLALFCSSRTSFLNPISLAISARPRVLRRRRLQEKGRKQRTRRHCLPLSAGLLGCVPDKPSSKDLLGPRLWGRQRAGSVRVARASSVTQPFSPTLPRAFALPLAAGRAVRLRATIRAHPAVLFQTSSLPGRALLLRLRWTAVTFSIRTTTGTVLSEQACRRSKQ